MMDNLLRKSLLGRHHRHLAAPRSRSTSGNGQICTCYDSCDTLRLWWRRTAAAAVHPGHPEAIRRQGERLLQLDPNLDDPGCVLEYVCKDGKFAYANKFRRFISQGVRVAVVGVVDSCTAALGNLVPELEDAALRHLVSLKAAHRPLSSGISHIHPQSFATLKSSAILELSFSDNL